MKSVVALGYIGFSMLAEMGCSLKVVNTQFHREIGRASRCRMISRSAGRSRLLNSQRNRSRQNGFVGVQIALSSPEWGSPGEETDREGGKRCL